MSGVGGWEYGGDYAGLRGGLCGLGVRALGGTDDGLQMGDVHDKDEE